MNYTEINFQSKQEVITAFESGQKIKCYRHGPLFRELDDGLIFLEGPHFKGVFPPKKFTWNLTGIIKKNVLISIL